MNAKTYFVYIMTNRRNGTLYIGVTNDIIRRVGEHRAGEVEGFTKKYALKRLVYFETFNSIDDAIHREKRLKTWLRAWKVRLIHQNNPEWNDLWEDILKG
jgi:putative endonuclease